MWSQREAGPWELPSALGNLGESGALRGPDTPRQQELLELPVSGSLRVGLGVRATKMNQVLV